MAKSGFEELEVYQLAEDMADAIWRVVLKWSPFARATVGQQAVRAADSVGANIAEGYGRAATKDNCRFVRIARGSLNETIHWMRRAYRRDLLKKSEVERLRRFFEELGPRLNAYLRSISGPSRGSSASKLRTTKYK
jgi:four helix bundle protein